MKKRLLLLATFRSKLAAVALGYKIRSQMKKSPIRTMVKEIQLMLRREGRQQSGYLKDQHRKKIRAQIVQFISALEERPLWP